MANRKYKSPNAFPPNVRHLVARSPLLLHVARGAAITTRWLRRTSRHARNHTAPWARQLLSRYLTALSNGAQMNRSRKNSSRTFPP